MERIRIAVSSCLVGSPVRWDGGHKRSEVVASLADRFDLVPLCPEVELGLGVPREPIELRGGRLVGVRSDRDLTDQMAELAARRADELEALGVAGVVLKKSSPSCGIHGTTGLFARILMGRLQRIPFEDEDRLAEPAAQGAFVERVLAAAASLRT
ncbi:MAG: DUF523 domain-containing protein [Deltaproteobacteria bacterium]|nr:DUF523 domain-containing protein [Deltaproteobacteria bacterium]